ncbi:MAG: sigma-54-dependent Fis family transcriptional regulator, partial [Deltaproteobacteria bacterium]
MARKSSREIDNPNRVDDTTSTMETRDQPIALQILVVDDEAVACESISYYLGQKGFAVKTAAGGREALRILREGFGDIVITDINMPAMNGLELTRQVRRNFPDVEIMLITGFSSEETVLQALKAGAADFFKKPVNMRELTAALYRCNRYRALKQENSRLRDAAAKGTRLAEEELYFGPSPPSRKLREELELAAAQPGVTVLLTGESGTGKELCARFIHAHGRRRKEPFIAVNCAAIPETLLERELFGHEKGAFTDARERVLGVFELAGNGTVLLDEIGEMTLAAQTRLLRVVENRTFRRLGGTRELILGECRLIAATNRNLEARVAAGEFRQDLYYRFQVLPIRVPPLRERK